MVDEPRSAKGQELLAHELIHTLQQSHCPPGAAAVALGDPADADEKQAERMASAGSGQKPAAAPHAFRVQRQMNQAPIPTPDLAESASPFLAGAIGSITIDGFDTGKNEISKANQTALARTARTIQTLLRKYPGSTINVTGHTDAVGKEENNQTLGQARAESVQAALVGLGIPAEAIMTASKGETQLLVKTEKAEARNRRVEVRFEPHATPSFGVQPSQGSMPSGSFGGDSAMDLNTPSTARSPAATPDTPSGRASPVPSPAKKAEPPAVGEIKALTELIKQTADAVKRDPLVRKLRDALAQLQPFMPAKDARKEIDNAIDALVKAGSDAGIMAILQAITGRSPSPVTDQQRQQTGPAVSQLPTPPIIQGPKIPINDAPKPAPKFSFQYRNGPQKSYAPGATIKFTLIAPDDFSTLPGAKRLVIVAEADRDAPNPDRFGKVSLESAAPMSIEMTAPQAPGKYLFRVDVGLGFDYSSMQEFEVTGPGKK
jgi:outer membrane protein OmpA-like peptidoglycan-associated protein